MGNNKWGFNIIFYKMTPSESEKLKEELEKERDIITSELESFATINPVVKGDYKSKFPVTNQSDTSDEKAHNVEEFEKERGVEQSLELRLKEINEALHKINSGIYGVCNRCKSPIEEKRLQAIPVAKLCVSCAMGKY